MVCLEERVVSQIYAELTLYSLKLDNQRTQRGNERLRIRRASRKRLERPPAPLQPAAIWFDKTWRSGEFELLK
jgi:hypothetical protein